MSYYNTTHLSGKDLSKSILGAKKQEIKILNHMLENNIKTIRPSQAFKLFDDGTPITSIRRAIHTLTDVGFLSKTSSVGQGMYGKKEHIWKLTEDNVKQLELL